jgi:hypothetical protein
MMNDADQLKMFLSQVAESIPVLLVCVVAFIVILTRWRVGSSGSVWAALGFGLVLVLCFVLPLAYIMIQQWALKGGQLQSREWVFEVYIIVVSVLRAIVYSLLLIAIYAGRPKPKIPDR